MRHILILLFLIVSTVPNLYASDKFTTQYLYLSILLVIFIGFSLKLKELINPLKNKILKYYLYFFIISAITIIYSFNKTESLIVLSRMLIWILVSFAMLNLIKGEKKYIDFTALVISIMCLVESAYIFYGFIERFDFENEFGRSAINKGFAGNINIAAFALVNKIPFLIYYFQKLIIKNKKFIILFPILVLPFFAIAITGTRGALFTIYLLLFILILMIFISFLKNLKFKNHIKNYFIIFFIAFCTSSLFTEILFESLSVSYRTEQIIERGSKSRIRYYNETFNYFKNNFIKGIGIGNWKIQSIHEDREFLEGYVVPYHAHNDFLQIAAETGIFGFLFYFIFFTFFIIITIKKIIFSKKINYSFPILLFLITYIIDSALNFPFSRPINNIVLFTSISLIGLENNFTNKKLNLFAIPLLVFVFISSYLVYKSHRQQMDLLYDFNENGNKLMLPIDIVSKFNMSYPNLSATALPLGAMIGRYYYEAEDYENAKKLLISSKKYNPFIQINNFYLGRVYEKLGLKDSAAYYFKLAHEGLPLNSLHAYDYMRQLIDDNNNEIIIDSIFEKVKNNDEFIIWNEYINYKVNVLIENPNKIREVKTLNLIDYAIKKFKKYELEFARYKMIVKYGTFEVLKAKEITEKAIIELEAGNYEVSTVLFDEAIKILPQEYSNYENLAFIKLKNEEPNQALNYLKLEIDNAEFIPSNGNYEYLMGLSFYSLGDNQNACKYFKLSIDKGNEDSKKFKPFCNKK